MNESEIKDKILAQFSKARKNPNAYFAESHFLDYLTSPGHKKNSIKKSFRGTKAYFMFMNAPELDFGICFTLPDLDKYYSVDDLTKKVIERISKKRGNLMILKRRREEKEKYHIELVLISILIPFYIWLGIHPVTIVLTVICAIPLYWILASKISERNHTKKLTIRILKNKA